jgi:hypothetical protein
MNQLKVQKILKTTSIAVTLICLWTTTHLSPFYNIVDRCRKTAKFDISVKKERKEILTLISDIENNEAIYLKPSYYKDVRRFYVIMLEKAARYYYQQWEFNQAKKCYIKANKYSVSQFSSQIEQCQRSHVKKKFMDRIGLKYKNSNSQHIQRLKKKMAQLVPISFMNREEPEIIEELTNETFSSKVRLYVDLYENISKKIPPTADTIESTLHLFTQIHQNHPISQKIKNLIDNYLYQWNVYHHIHDGFSYEEKESAHRKRLGVLQTILRLSKTIVPFNIHINVQNLIPLIKAAETGKLKWSLHNQIRQEILRFDEDEDFLLDNLYLTADHIKLLLQQCTPESPLKEKANRFALLPDRHSLTIDNLKKYLEPRWNLSLKEIPILKNEFARQLTTHIKTAIYSGGRTLDDLKIPLDLSTTYLSFFQKQTPWHQCILWMEKYFNFIKQHDYISLMNLYKPNTHNTCSGIFVNWNLFPKEKVKKLFCQALNRRADIVLLQPNKKSKQDFIDFSDLYSIAHCPLNSNHYERFRRLFNYFKADSPKSRNKAAVHLEKYFPKLAKSYDISYTKTVPKPTEEEIFTRKSLTKQQPESQNSKTKKNSAFLFQKDKAGKITITNQAPDAQKKTELPEFMDMLFKYCLKKHTLDQKSKRLCRELIDKPLDKPVFVLVVGRYKSINKIPENYSFQLNQFFYFINKRPKGWQKSAQDIITGTVWKNGIRYLLERYLKNISIIY